jgi:Permuted papain-like amidase enzyme, YaeF/YiiX, C92 family
MTLSKVTIFSKLFKNICSYDWHICYPRYSKLLRLCAVANGGLMSKIFFIFLFSVSAFAGAASPRPEFKTGDLIFQTSKSNQSDAIMWATKSPLSHVGMIRVQNSKITVIEAVEPLREFPLDQWIAKGRDEKFKVFRWPGLKASQGDAMMKLGLAKIGTHYDIYFTGRNGEFYCSELVAWMYQGVGLKIGRYQKLKEFDFDLPAVRRLIDRRLPNHPLCKGQQLTRDECWKLVLEDEIVAPVSIADDAALDLVFSSYP